MSIAVCRSRNAGIQRPDALISLHALDRRPGDISATQRPPSDAEALLRREVVGVGLGDVDWQAAGARGGVDHHERAVVGARRPGVGRDRDAGRGLVVRRGVDVDAGLGGELGRVAGVGGDDVGSPRCGAALAAAANFEPNSPKDRNCARSSIRPNVAASQNAVEPPLPSTTS